MAVPDFLELLKRHPKAVASAGLVWSDLQLVVGSGILLVVLVASENLLWPLQPLRLVLAPVWVLLVPGYCLTSALFPRRSDLDNIARIGLSCGISIALIPLLAMLLDQLPWGIRTGPIVLTVFVETLVFSAIALWRRAKIEANAVFAPDVIPVFAELWRTTPLPRRRVQGIATAVLATLIVVGATAVLRERVPPTTEFYVLGGEGSAERYPQTALVGAMVGVTVGINNREGAVRKYRVEAWVTELGPLKKRRLLTHIGPIDLASGHSREWPLNWSMTTVGDDQRVDVLLFMDGVQAPARELTLWIDVSSREPADG